MTVRTLIVGATTALLLSRASVASASAPCAAARPTPRVVFQPDAWRIAADELLKATAIPGQPWSCTGGVIDLVAHDEGGATLTVVDDDGRSIVREIASPEDVAPLGEALLSKPEPAPPAANVLPNVESAPAPATVARDTPSPIVTPAAPRALLSALVMPRYAGQSNLIWGGITGGVSLPFGSWRGGAWARYDGPSAALSSRPMSLNELCIGLSVGRSFALGSMGGRDPVEIRASVVPSVAVVTHGGGVADETRIDGRIGVEARGVLPISTSLRAVLALDGELAPRELGGGPERPNRDQPSIFPAYTVGLGLGMELAVR